MPTLLKTNDSYQDFKYYINGRRVTREIYHEYFDRSNCENRLSCAYTKRKNGKYYHYWESTLPFKGSK